MIGIGEGPVIGLAISTDAIRAVLLVAGRVTWHHERIVAEAQPLEDLLHDVLRNAPRTRWRRPRVAAAVGPAHSQLRRLRHLPAVRGRQALASIVQESAGRYFLLNGVPLVTTQLAPLADGARWAGAIEAPTVAAVVGACRAAGMQLARVAPTAALLGYAAPDGRLAWADGDVLLRLEYEGTTLTECRRVPASQGTSADQAHPVMDAALETLQPDAMRFADAFAAARGVTAATLALAPERIGGGEPSVLRLAIAGVACVGALLLALASPGLSATRAERAATLRLRTMDTSRAAFVSDAAAMDSLAALVELAAFRRATPSVTLLLASLTDAIEAPTMLVSVRLDESAGTMTALTPSAASLLDMLAQVHEISEPTIVGAVTSEVQRPSLSANTMQAGPVPMSPIGPSSTASDTATPAERMERVTVRFRWKGVHPSGRPSPAESSR